MPGRARSKARLTKCFERPGGATGIPPDFPSRNLRQRRSCEPRLRKTLVTARERSTRRPRCKSLVAALRPSRLRSRREAKSHVLLRLEASLVTNEGKVELDVGGVESECEPRIRSGQHQPDVE